MAMLRLIEFAIAAVTLMFLAQQVFLPLWRGRLIFPMFREEGKIEDELAAQNQAQHEAALRSQLKQDDKPSKKKVKR